jgi:magnesium-transporting ATPase (P-type)
MDTRLLLLLGVWKKKEDDKFEFQGLIALSDCPREDSKEVIQTRGKKRR